MSRVPAVLFGLSVAVAFADANLPVLKKGTLEELLKPETRGGSVLRVPGFDLGEPGVKWMLNGMSAVFEPFEGQRRG